MSKGTQFVHDYFSRRMSWKPEKGDSDQYVGINFKASWVGEAIDEHVAQRIRDASESAREELELLREKVAVLQAELDRLRPASEGSSPETLMGIVLMMRRVAPDASYISAITALRRAFPLGLRQAKTMLEEIADGAVKTWPMSLYRGKFESFKAEMSAAGFAVGMVKASDLPNDTPDNPTPTFQIKVPI